MYLLFVVDGDGLGKIVVLFILAKTVIEAIDNIFKKYDEAWSKTHVIMSDKYLNKRDAFSSYFS